MKLCLRLLLGLSLALSWLIPAGAQAAPAGQEANLVANPGFEGGGGSWSPWWAEIPKPADNSFNYAYRPNSFNVESLSGGAAAPLVLAGNSSYRVFNNWDPFYAGLKQVVTAPAGSRVRLTASARAWAASEFWPAPSDANMPVRTQVGIEPEGSENQFASNVVWSGAAAPHNAWAQMSVEATVGASGRVLIILSGDYRGASKQFMGVFFDEVSLTVVGQTQATATAPAVQASPTTGAAATAAPTRPQAATQPAAAATATRPASNSGLPTPRPDGKIIYIVQEGDTGWVIAANAGLTIDQLRQLNPNVNIDLLSVGTELVIGQSTPSAAPTSAVTATTAAEATAPAEATAVPTGDATPAAEGTPIEDMPSVCVLLFEDVNGDNQRQVEAEGAIAGGLISLINADTGTTVAEHTTSGDEIMQTSEPDDPQPGYCFMGVEPGNYRVAAAPPSGYNATSQSDFALSIAPGSTGTQIRFGAQRGADAPVVDPAPPDDGSRLRNALFGAVGVMLLLLAAGLGVTLVMRRR
jgi:LysM repeat protein